MKKLFITFQPPWSTIVYVVYLVLIISPRKDQKISIPTGASKMDHMIFLPSWVKLVISIKQTSQHVNKSIIPLSKQVKTSHQANKKRTKHLLSRAWGDQRFSEKLSSGSFQDNAWRNLPCALNFPPKPYHTSPDVQSFAQSWLDGF